MFEVDDLLLEGGHFWCVFDMGEHPKTGRMVRAYIGKDAEDDARRLAGALNDGGRCEQ